MPFSPVETDCQTFDAGLSFGLNQLDREGEEGNEEDNDFLSNPFRQWKALVTRPEGIKASDPNQ